MSDTWPKSDIVVGYDRTRDEIVYTSIKTGRVVRRDAHSGMAKLHVDVFPAPLWRRVWRWLLSWL